MQDSIRQGSTLCRPTHHHRRRKVPSDWGGACCVPIAATTEKVPRCQRSLLLVDVRSFWEIAAVVVKPEVHPLGLVVAHLSPQHGYLIHAMRQRSMPGSGLRILALAGSESAEGSIGFPEVNPRSHPGLLYLRHSPYLPTFPPHHLILPLLRDLSTHISVKPTSI
jgi:hypothetical protein